MAGENDENNVWTANQNGQQVQAIKDMQLYMVNSMPSPGPSSVGYKTTEVPITDLQLSSAESLDKNHLKLLTDQSILAG